MSDSGFTGPPPVTPPTASELRPARGDVLKIVDTVGMIRNNARMQRLAGEIVAENKDGTLRIATTAGDITVQKPANRPDLTVGAKVEIDIPAGHPPRQLTLRETQPPQPQQQTPPPTPVPSRDTPAPPPIVTAPPRAPVNIPDLPRTPPPQTTPAPVTPDQIIRLLPLPPAQATQIVQPPVDIIDILLPVLPPANIIAAPVIAQAAPEALTEELLTTLLKSPAPEIAAQQLTNVILPQLPASSYVTPTPLPASLPPAVQTVAQQLIGTLLTLNTPAPQQGAAPQIAAFTAPPITTPAPAPLIQFMPPVATPPTSTPFSLLTTPLPPAMAAFAALVPENLIQTAPVTPAQTLPATGMIAPKMDAQILSITAPAIKISAPGVPPLQQTQNAPANPFMPDLTAAFAAPPEVPAGMLAAHVRGITPQNFPVLSVAFPALNAVQDFVMQFPAANMLPGAQVTMQPQPGSFTPVTAAAALPFTPFPELMTPGLWPALDEAFQALQSAAPQAAHMLAQTSLPSPAAPVRMPAVIMMFVAAMQGGDLQNWLGEKSIDSLRRIGKADVISRIARDGAAISRLAASETAPQDWRSMPVPMLWDNHVHKIMLHYRHDREASKSDTDKRKGTRFVLDIAPPRMGTVQLDGLHRPGEANGRLDLIVRTKENLSPPMQQSMRRLYVHALEQAQLSGELSFQNNQGNWVRIEP